MIGVLNKESQRSAVEEFFQLFKTPWEFANPGTHYSVLLADGVDTASHTADVLMIFGSTDARRTHPGRDRDRWLASEGIQLPLYSDVDSLTPPAGAFPIAKVDETVAGYVDESAAPRLCRFGYSLFAEVAFLLENGQPESRAPVATLDAHISLLRTTILRLGVPVLEIPPRPAGVDFICCLTHDVDFLGLARHRFDRTFFGFLKRATVDTVFSAVKGVRPWSEAGRNLAAALKAPGVLLGLAKDPWEPFRDYQDFERPRPSTFFVLPAKGHSGLPENGKSDPRRASKYDVNDAASSIQQSLHGSNEVGLHGIDAWTSTEAARTEKERIDTVTGQPTRGVRMHWLYSDSATPRKLERAGLQYDSTVGYNAAVGFRAGTGQVYLMPGTTTLLELPMLIQDTAMFYPDRMGLDEREALKACASIVEHCSASGGVLTINWHGRSLAPERLWGRFYRELLNRIEEHSVWFATASEAVDWFSARRQIRFRRQEEAMTVQVDPGCKKSREFVLREHRPEEGWQDLPWARRQVTSTETTLSGERLLVLDELRTRPRLIS